MELEDAENIGSTNVVLDALLAQCSDEQRECVSNTKSARPWFSALTMDVLVLPNKQFDRSVVVMLLVLVYAQSLDNLERRAREEKT